MITVSFPNWSDALAVADLPEKVRQQHRIIIQWFLGYLKREQAAATQVSARQFVAHLMETRQPKAGLKAIRCRLIPSLLANRTYVRQEVGVGIEKGDEVTIPSNDSFIGTSMLGADAQPDSFSS